MKPKTKQSIADQLNQLARIYEYSSQAEPEEMKAAAKKVGLTKEHRLEWAVDFSQQENTTKADAYNRNLELAVFHYPPLASTDKPIPYNAGNFIDPVRIPELQERFLKHIKAAAAGIGFSFPLAHVRVYVDQGGVSYQVTAPAGTDEYFAAQLEHAELTLIQLIGEHWGYIGFCDPKKFGCGKYFVKSRIDREYCSKSCVNKATTYRARGKEPAA